MSQWVPFPFSFSFSFSFFCSWRPTGGAEDPLHREQPHPGERPAAARLPLYGPDDFHPSETGTFLAALVITAGLLDLDPARLPCDAVLRGGRRVAIPEAACGMIRAAAAAAVTPVGGP